MSVTNKVLYDIDQRNDTTPEQKETARKNIGAYEDKTAGGIPKADLASDVQSSLVKADSSVQSVTSNGQSLTKSAAGAIDIPKATDTKWGVVQVVNELKDNQNVIPNSRVIKEAVDGLSAALQARATFWTVQEWQTQSAQPGDPSKIYYVGPKGTGNDQYDMYEWRTKTNSYVLTDESTISLDGYWHGAPDIIGEDTLAPFVTSIEKNADDTVKYRTCSATVGDLSLPVFMDSGVVTPADPHYMYPTVNESTSYEEVKRLVDAGYRPIFVPDVNSFGVHTRYILTGAIAKGYTPTFIFTALIPGSKYTRYFTSERMQTVICQHANDETEKTWVWNDEVLIPNIPEPNQMGSDVGKVLTVGEYGELYWDEPAGGNNVEVKAGTDNLHVTSADVNDQTIFTMSADYYHSSGNYAGTYTGPGTVIVDPTTMNLESTNSAYGYREQMNADLGASSGSYPWKGNLLIKEFDRGQYLLMRIAVSNVRSDMAVELTFKSGNTVVEVITVDSNMLLEMKYNDAKLRIPWDSNYIDIKFISEDIVGDGTGYSNAGFNFYYYSHSDNKVYGKSELAWKEETYNYIDEGIASREPRLPVHGSGQKNKVLTVSGNNGELGWTSPASYREGQYIHIDANNVITASGLQPKLATPNSECYLCGTENGGMWWFKRKKYMYISDLTSHTLTQTDVNNKYCDLPINWDVSSDARICNFMFCMGMSDMYMKRGSSTLPVDIRVKKIKCSIFNDGENTWYSNDNAHPSDPNGMIFNDILGSELSRVGGYWSLNTEVKRAGMSGPYLLDLSGPSFRVVFNSDADIQVGDVVVMSGRISGIDFRNGGWGEI